MIFERESTELLSLEVESKEDILVETFFKITKKLFNFMLQGRRSIFVISLVKIFGGVSSGLLTIFIK